MADVFVHADGLYRYALRLAGDADAAADLVQDALVSACDAYDRLRPDTNHRAWVFTILRNRFLSRMRRAGREEELSEPDRVPDSAPDALDRMVRQEDGYRHGFDDHVLLALGSLSEPQRTAVLLCDVEGMRYEEIAIVMGCPVGTVRSRIHHAREKLRQALEVYARTQGYGGRDVAL